MPENQGVLVRIAAALLFGAISGLALWRTGSRDRAVHRRWLYAAAVTIILVAVFWTVVWLALAAARLSYPFEMEWCGGAMKDTVERALHGQPIYVAPNPGWFPYEYMPLYFWASALLIRLTHLTAFTGMRLISSVSTAASAVLMVVWVRMLNPRTPGRLRFTDWAAPAGAVGIFMAAYRITGAWYDTERLDMLYIALSLLGCVWLQLAMTADTRRRSTTYAVLSAAAFALAFLTKQQASLFVIACALALLWRGKRRLAALFSAASVLLSGVPLWLMNRASHGWLWYYAVHVPLANGTQPSLARLFLFRDVPMFAPLLALILVGLTVLHRGAGEAKSGQSLALAAAAALSAAIQSGISRAHFGGYDNVLITAWVWTPVLACAVASRLIAVDAKWLVASAAPLLLQMLALTYRPTAQLPTPANFAAGIRFAATVRRLEQRGAVLVLDHGGFSTPAHFQFMALHDVNAADTGEIRSTRQAIRDGRYDVVITDAYPKSTGLPPELAANYSVVQSLDITTGWCLTGYLTPGRGRPGWLLIPNRVPRAKGGHGSGPEVSTSSRLRLPPQRS
ncbi:MAG: hypothetical protein KGJ62_02915 [Armatimonadetes bacterium]|nr:hypothetical protein [Armatimonadota bacterium]MDE2205603.1 hypothetical protein [Armatimonadota bacterium]